MCWVRRRRAGLEQGYVRDVATRGAAVRILDGELFFGHDAQAPVC